MVTFFDVHFKLMNNVYVDIMMTSISEHTAFPKGSLGVFKIHIFSSLSVTAKSTSLQKPTLFVFIYLSQLVRLFTSLQIYQSVISSVVQSSWRYYEIYGLCKVSSF